MKTIPSSPLPRMATSAHSQAVLQSRDSLVLVPMWPGNTATSSSTNTNKKVDYPTQVKLKEEKHALILVSMKVVVLPVRQSLLHSRRYRSKTINT